MKLRAVLVWAFLLIVIKLPQVTLGGPYGLDTRAPVGSFLNNTLPQSQPAFGAFKTVKAFPNLVFFDPTFLLPEPGTNRLYVGLRQGQIWFFPNDPNTTNRTLFLDLTSTTQGWDDSGLLGMAFHPEFRQPGSTNRGYIYIYRNYSATPEVLISGRLPPTTPSFDRLSRFTVPDGSLVADPNSELVLINQYDHHLYHNGGGMFFGADGFLYLSIGDEGDSYDDYDSSQKLNAGLLSGVFRIDVNKDPTKSHAIRRQPLSSGIGAPPSYSSNYFIPNDNPFLDAGGTILEEYWALGVRSPHRMTRDPVSGQIWLGDVGEHTVEEVDLIVRGGNYQWAYKEGNFAAAKDEPVPLIGTNKPPVYDYIHADNNGCVIGGYVYRGNQFAAELGGKYIFGDNGSGRIWSLVYNGTNAPTVTQIASMPAGFNYTGLGSFGLDQSNELYMCQIGTNGYIWKLAPQDAAPQLPPALLSQTGVFTNLATLATTNGFIPFTVNSPLWSDAAHKTRWAAIPNDGAPYGANEQVTFSTNGEWTFPAGTVFVKHFELSTNENNPSLHKRLETRLLITDTNGGVYGLTYKWRANNSDADLLTNSLNEAIVVTTPSGTRTQTWYYPSRQDCLTCHNSNAKFILGPKTRQFNGDFTYPSTGVTDNQLRTWNHLGLFNPSLNENAISNYLASVNVTNTAAPLGDRVRSYIDSNCSHCHRPNGVQAYFDARYDTPLTNQALINGLVNNNLGITGAKIVVPTNILKSILHVRDSTVGANQMPPLAKNMVDTNYIAVLTEWINSLPPTPDLPPPWLHQDIGSVGLPGDADYSGGTFNAIGSGSDIYGNSDSFHYIYQPVSGDAQITARVRSLQFTDPWAKAGVMIRETLDESSRHTFMALTPGNGPNMQYRLNAFDVSGNDEGGTNQAPYWVKLTRVGTTFSGYKSEDGINWILINTITNLISDDAYIGLAVTAHNNAALNTAVFDNVSLQSAPPPTASISAIANQSTSEDTATAPIAFTVGSQAVLPWLINVTGTSTNQALVGNTNIFVSGFSSNRTVTVLPSANQFGQTLITLTANDGSSTATSSFLLTVNPVNDPPTLSSISPTTRNTGGSAFNVSLAGIGSGAANESQTLSLDATSSSTSVCSIVSITYTSPQSTGTLRLRPGTNPTTGVAIITVTVNDGGAANNTFSQTFPVYVKTSGNASPTISSIANQSTPEDTAIGPVAFTVIDSGTPADLLTVSGTSSNPLLVPNGNISFGGSSSNRNLTITPAAGQTGTTTITVSATDTNFGSSFTTFTLTVTPANDPPVISTFTNVTILKNTSSLPLPFTVGDYEKPATQLTVSGTSTNAALLPNTNIVFYGTGTNRAVVLTPLPDQIGYSSVSVVVSDGAASATNSFLVNVSNGANGAAPAISNIATQTVTESSLLSLQIVATDLDFLTYSLGGSPPSGMTINANSGLLTWTPTEAQGPSTTVVSVIVSDNGLPSLSSTQAFTVIVLETNQPPVLSAQTNRTILEQTALSITNSATDADVPANLLTFSLDVFPGGMTINTNSGVISWTPTEAQGPSTNAVTVIVRDSGIPSMSATQSFSVIVLESNSPPSLLPRTNRTIFELTALSVTNVASDSDLPANTLTFSLDVFPTGMTINTNSGVISWTPTEGQGPSTNNVMVVVHDSGVPSLTATQSFSVFVLETNQAPVLSVITNRTIFEQTVLSVTNVATDGDLPPHILTYTLDVSPGGMTINTNTGIISWTPVEADGPSTNAVTVVVHDNGVPSLSSTQSFTVVVLESNAPPVLAVVTNRIILEQSSLAITNVASDPDIPTNSLWFSLDVAPVGMTMNTNTGAISWTTTEIDGPSTNAVTVVAHDNGVPSLTATQSFTVIVLESNLPPVLSAITNRTMVEQTALSITNSATDPDVPANLLTFSLDVFPTGMTINTNSGVISWTPTEAEGPGSNFVSVVVRDNGAPILSATQSFSVIVLESNQVPALAAITNRTIFEQTLLAITNVVVDPDIPTNTLAFSLDVAPFGMTINTNTGLILWTPSELDGPGTNTVTVVVQDNGIPSLSSTQSFTVIVLESNLPPVLAPRTNRTVVEQTLLSVTNSATDPDVPANVLTFSLNVSPVGMTINTNSGVISWTPTEADGPSTNTVRVVVKDNGLPSLTATQSFTVIVLESNTPPALSAITNRTIFEQTTLAITNLATDADLPANVLTFALGVAPAGMTINTNSGVILWTPSEADGPSTNAVIVVVHDNSVPSLTATQSFTVVVLESNAPPILTAITNRTIFELTALSITNAAGDPDVPANLLTFSLLSAPAGMTINTNSGVINWTPTEAQGPSSNFLSVVVSDDGLPLLSTTQSFAVVVLETNQPPVLAATSNQFILELTAFGLTNSASDGDLPTNTLTFTLDVAPSGMTINTNTGVISWTPSEAQGPSTNAVLVVVHDSGSPSLTATQAFTAIVLESNQPPALAAISNQTIVETLPYSSTNSATDGDLPANLLTFSLSSAPSGMTIDTNSGVIQWIPSEAQGPSTNLVTVIVRDSGVPSLCATQSFTLLVLETNQSPALTAISNQTIVELLPYAFTNTATDADLPTNTLAYSLDVAPAGMVIDTNSGVLTWTPSEAQGPSTNSVVVVVRDNGIPSLTATQAFTLIVLETNQAPILAPIVDRIVHAGAWLTFTNSATDSDIPTNALTYSTDSGFLPGGPSIGATNGVFTWMPSDTFANTTNTFTVRVTDDGIPPLEATQSFHVTVVPRPLIETISVFGHTVTLQWRAIEGQSYVVQWTEDLNDTTWKTMAGVVTATGPVATKDDTLGEASQRFYRIILAP